MAWGLAQQILCEELNSQSEQSQAEFFSHGEKNHHSEFACGVCHSCLRTEQRSSESVLEIRPESQQIKVDQARQVLDFLHLKGWQKQRIIIIDDIHLMNAQAANSLLKSIEEPPEDTVFFLLAPAVTSVLPTIRSRSQVFQFGPLSNETLRELRQAPLWALSAARGSLERLESLLDEGEIIETAQKLLREFIHDQHFLTSDQWRPEVKARVQAQKILWWWDLWLMDSVAKKNLDYLHDNLREAILGLPVSKRLFLIEQCLKYETQIGQFVDPVLAFEKNWVEFHHVD
jgi:DNA polymerase-3 subunit delta'